MAENLRNSDTGIIAEFKRKSPSKGWFNKEADVRTITRAYQENGATALSILTDVNFFGGSNFDLRDANLAKVRLPKLYKNFIIDEYQLYQARLYKANAVLLIAACLSKDECRQLMTKAHDLGMEVLLEMHSEAETEYAELEPDMCGINNRNLGTFVTDVNNSVNLAARLPEDAVKVSESGISDPETVKMLRGLGYKGFLMGEHFMSTPDPGAALAQFIARLQ
jgi:indole-3-glycerol phosphate synthase